jgi:hypothetical protein
MGASASALATARSARLLAAGLASICAVASGVALSHMLETARRGVICGVADGGHCWACYAAPLLGLAAAASWGWAKTLPRPARARL